MSDWSEGALLALLGDRGDAQALPLGLCTRLGGVVVVSAPKLCLVTWGAFCWCSTTEGHHLAFKVEPHDLVYLITQCTWGTIEGIPQHMTKMDVGT